MRDRLHCYSLLLAGVVATVMVVAHPLFHHLEGGALDSTLMYAQVYAHTWGAR